MNMNAPPLTVNYVHSSCEYIPSAGVIIMDECQRLYIGDGVHKITELPIISYVPEPEIDAQTFLEQNIDLIEHNNFNELYRRMPLSIVGDVTKILRECGINPLAC